MTRDEVCQILEHPLHNTSEFALKRNRQVLAHDQAQRETIEQQVQEIERLNARNEYVHREYRGVVDSYSSLEQENKVLREVIAKLEAEHADLVLRNKLLRDRPDLPLERIKAYDAVVAKIDQQAQEIKSLTNQFHENLERQAKRVGELEAKIEQQVKEIAQWKAAAQMHNGVYEPLQQENKALREVLQAICSGISGDLLGTTSMDRETMQSIAQQALKEVS